MFTYLKTKAEFLEDMETKGSVRFAIEDIQEEFIKKTGEIPSLSERKSWKKSLPVMSDILKDEEIPDSAGVGIEYKFPTAPYRVDFMISGYDADHRANVIVIELKQWSANSVKAISGLNNIVNVKTADGWQYKNHPSCQALSYVDQISETNQAAEDNDIVFSSCAFLHNYVHDQSDSQKIFADQFEESIKQAPAFVKGEEEDLRAFIKERIKEGDDAEILKEIESGKVKPSRSLQESLVNVIQGNTEYQLLDEQKTVYEEIKYSIEKSLEDKEKRVVIVPGGPGTGKSVIAINLLAELHKKDDISCVYTSKNSSPRNYYINKVYEEGTDPNIIKSLFQWSGTVAHNTSNTFNVVLVDEAHRLVDETKSDPDFYTKSYKYPVNEIEGIINAGQVSVFFIDEQQRVSMEDIGTIEGIIKGINDLDKHKHVHVSKYTRTQKLVSQFRCGGSSGYLDWLDSTLQIKGAENNKTDLKGVDYDFRVIDSPNELVDLIREKDNDADRTVGSRVVAGYCWEWEKSTSDKKDPDIHEICKIPGYEDFEMSWNLQSKDSQKDKKGNYNQKYSYAYDKDSINQIGCIHTVQGLDFDYIGVIIGEDMRYENGKIVTDRSKRAKSDHSLKGVENEADPYETADTIIKNTYRVLMSRGLKGCYVFCVDKGLKEYLIERSKKD